MGIDFVDHECIDSRCLLYAGNDNHSVHWFFEITPSERIILNVFVVAVRCQFSYDFLISVLWSTVFLRRYGLDRYVPAAFADQLGAA